MTYHISLSGTVLPEDFIYQGDLAEGDRTLSLEESKLYEKGEGFIIQDHLLVDISETDDYKKKKKIEELDKRLYEIDNEYRCLMDSPVNFKNGYSYKPSYLNDYALLIATDVFPINIWDSSEINQIQMNKEELLELSLFLKEIGEPAFQKRKAERASVLREKIQLEQQ